jgi:heat shock protein HslJ
MKQLLLVILFTGVFGTASINAQVSNPLVSDSADLAGEWWLQPVLASDTATGRLPRISFDLPRKRFKGFTGCNQMSGVVNIKADGILFDKDMTITRIACEGYNEKEFIVNLLRVTRYQIKDGVLSLLIEKTPVSRWIRKSASGIVAGKPM